MIPIILSLLAALIITTLIMVLTWFWARKINNFGIVDAAWSFAFGIHIFLFYIFYEGHPLRKLLLISMVMIWSLRLGFYLTKRLAKLHPEEDSRYVKLRAEYGADFSKKFLIFFIYQAISVSVLTLPFAFAMNSAAEISSYEYFGFIFWSIAILGETLADNQMSQFKTKPENKGQVCNIGLWKYSRHPNYFFESLIWWGFYIFCLGSVIWWGIYAPLIILFLLLKVTGVPPSEEQSLLSRGDRYREYQKTTSVFVPWFTKK